MKPWWFCLTLFALLLVAACNRAPAAMLTPTPAPAVPPDPNAVPEATLTDSEGAMQIGVPGTRCWRGGCMDAAGIMAPPEALRVAPGETLIFSFGAGDPSSVSLQVREWVPNEAPGPDGTAMIGWDAPIAASGDLDPAAATEWEVPLEPGEYALNAMSFYQIGNVGGDIAYGWHIIVE